MISGSRPVETKTNYLLGSNRNAWVTNVPNYEAVLYKGMYRGVDLVFYSSQKQLEYDLVLSPDADLSGISFALEGFSRAILDSRGDLTLSSAAGDFIQRKPVVYEEHDSKRRRLEANYVLYPNNQIGFAVRGRHKGSPLVIDPVLIYSTFIGGTGQDQANAVAVDSAGNLRRWFGALA